MNTHQLCTRTEKAETQPEIVVRKADKKLRKTENSQFELRIFRDYQPLTSKNTKIKNFAQPVPDTTIVDSDFQIKYQKLEIGNDFPLLSARAARTEGQGEGGLFLGVLSRRDEAVRRGNEN